MKFYGVTNQGIVTITNRSTLENFLKGLDGGFEIKITPTKDLRNLKMNNLYWLWLTHLSDYSGYTKKELHNYFKMKLLCHEEEIKGEKIIDCVSTSELTIKEFSDYLINVSKLSIEIFNYSFPDPLPLCDL